MYCGSSEARAIVYNRSFNRLWYGQGLSRVKIVLIPFNINFHWILIALDLNERIIYILDLLTNESDIHSENITNSVTIGPSILQHIFSRDVSSVNVIPHLLQTDAVSCGFLICHYALGLAKDGNLSKPVNLLDSRRDIFVTVSESAFN